ncbi:hypothetical protein JR316_0003630 [Psilocybe cubensis]|uniref:Uncharacterized protein n=2 Tax=Psilocybe cubensis TaxID=181762 RepID=A0ACB8H826_PSICU|nr:hypothetical protein JR316_0003630 [Psilocybe cubensis]KAH9484150.1 hypothetical protein JR316_0003630 [Psilocybe cubensis]
MDTETLFALVASQLPEKDLSFTQDTIMDALLTSNGNVDAAVRYLLDTRTTKTKKRKHINLDTWLRSSSRSKQVKSKLEGPGPSSTMTVSSSNHIQQSTSSALNSNSEKTVNLLSVLRQPPSLKKEPSRLPPMLLSNPQMVAKYTPCTMHLGVLPPELACRLFHTMINASKNWKRNKWWLFDRVVESPHLTSFFARKTDGLDDDENWQEAAQYWYNGRMTEPPEPFSPEMEEACKIIEHVVNEEMKNRKRFTLEWAGKDGADPLWRANVAASNCYQGGRESVGFHSDQVTYLGPYPTIASLSLERHKPSTFRWPTTHS